MRRSSPTSSTSPATSSAASRCRRPPDARSTQETIGRAPLRSPFSRTATRRGGSAAQAVGQPILVNNIPFTVAGVAPPEFFGVDPGIAPAVYLPQSTDTLLDPDAAARNVNPNYYWIGIMGRLRPGVT